MPSLQPVSRSRHGSLRWKRHTDYQFAKRAHFTGLVMAELAKAQCELPIGFALNDSTYSLVCLLGLNPNENVLIGPAGNWLGDYIPAAFRSYPFRLANNENGEQLLCIDEDSGLVTSNVDDEPFFTEDGEPAQSIQDILTFLNTIEGNRKATALACSTLQKHNLIEPWPLQVKIGEKTTPVEGLYRINEAALNSLKGDALEELQKAGGMLVAYCQLLSMQQVSKLGRLATAAQQQERDREDKLKPTTSHLPLDDKGISFDDLL